MMKVNDDRYCGLMAEAYDILYPEGYAKNDVSFYKSIIGEGLPGTVLEIACGSGRVTLPLRRENIDIEGLDASHEMLDILKKKAKKEGFNITTYHLKMQDFSLNRKFSTIIVPFSSFTVLEKREDALKAIENFYLHLETGGQLLIEIFVPFRQDGHIRNLSNFQWKLHKHRKQEDGSIVLVSVADCYDEIEQILSGIQRYEVFKDGQVIKTEIFESLIRIYTKNEMELLLEKVGFHVCKIFGDYDLHELNADHRVMIFQAVKDK